ncbi:hypothetical protein BC938DRAFT_474928 [Jimgerdemannia flammicorona]|uniref:Uncharacterized protein n=1 Tax=Jimgerdemannia flammicorona TaxID=994334 RepID=A0A433Q1H2_9FUNG|nr:hypothetical protein BC938DRAFT_474928 [Jimgerdemannia flammicorona]
MPHLREDWWTIESNICFRYNSDAQCTDHSSAASGLTSGSSGINYLNSKSLPLFGRFSSLELVLWRISASERILSSFDFCSPGHHLCFPFIISVFLSRPVFTLGPWSQRLRIPRTSKVAPDYGHAVERRLFPNTLD